MFRVLLHKFKSNEGIRKLRDVGDALEASQRRSKGIVGRGRGLLSAETDEEALKAIWDGINHAQALYQVLHGLSNEYAQTTYQMHICIYRRDY